MVTHRSTVSKTKESSRLAGTIVNLPIQQQQPEQEAQRPRVSISSLCQQGRRHTTRQPIFNDVTTFLLFYPPSPD